MPQQNSNGDAIKVSGKVVRGASLVLPVIMGIVGAALGGWAAARSAGARDATTEARIASLEAGQQKAERMEQDLAGMRDRLARIETLVQSTDQSMQRLLQLHVKNP